MDDTAHPATPVASLIERMTRVPSRGAIMDGPRRYLMLRTDVLMGLLHELPAELRPTVLQALANSVRRHGGQSARAYFDAGGARPDQLLSAITAYSPELGWGHWRIDLHTAEAIEVSVASSPFAEGFGRSADPVCHAILGMLQAVGTLVFAGPVEVVETCCAAQAGVDRCHFRIVPASAGTRHASTCTGRPAA